MIFGTGTYHFQKGYFHKLLTAYVSIYMNKHLYEITIQQIITFHNFFLLIVSERPRPELKN